jgi:RHS repeat-associated protein
LSSSSDTTRGPSAPTGTSPARPAQAPVLSHTTGASPVAPPAAGNASTTTAAPPAAGNDSIAPPPAAQSGTAPIGFYGGLSAWDISVVVGSPTGKGSVTAGSAILREGDSFQVGLERSFTVPKNPAPLVFHYTDLNFDTSDPGSIKDAFEASLVDAQGQNLVHPYAPGRDAFFNVTEGVGLAVGPETVQAGDTIKSVTVDLSGVLPGTEATIRFRLVNNDQDTQTSVHILDVLAPTANQPPVVDGIAPQTTAEGQLLSVSTSFTDPDTGDSHTATVDWGDGTTTPATVTPGTDGTGTVTAGHVYADNGSYTAHLIVTDAQGATADTSFSVTVSNVGPSVVAGVSFQATVASGVPQIETVLGGSFTDPGFDRPSAGTSERFTVSVDWGDGTTETVAPSITQGSEGVPTLGHFSARHVYAQAGVYSATGTVTDDDAGVGTAVVRYGVARLSVTRGINIPAGGSVPVLVLRDPGFDATQIDVNTVRFAPAGARPGGNVMQVRPTDVRFNFPVAGLGVHQSDSQAFLTGRLQDGTPFASVDAISVVGGAGLPAPSQAGATRFFVADAVADSAFRYDPAGAMAGSFALDVNAHDVRGVASNAAGDRVWAIDAVTQLVTVQGGDGRLLGWWRPEGLQSPVGVSSDGTDVWVVDAGSKQVLRYAGAAALLAGSSVAASRFSLDPENNNPSDLVTDGRVVWVTDEGRDEVFVYDTAGTLLGRWKLDPANADASGITKDPTGASGDLWVVDRADRVVYAYAGGTAWRDGLRSASSTFVLASGDTSPEGIADPPTVSVSEPASGTALPAGQTVVVTGQALDGTCPAYPVRVNGQAVDALDAAGNFFQPVQVALGTNTFVVEASDAAGDTATRTITVQGTQLSAVAVDFARLSVVSGSTLGLYGRTSWQDADNVLFADLGVKNLGQYAVGGPVLVGVTNISDPTVRLRGATGTTPDGIPYFDISSLVTGRILRPGDSSGLQTISFLVPDRARFTYDLVFFAGLNQAPRFTTVPDVEAISGHPYAYDVSAADPDGDALTFSLVSAPAGMTVAADTGRITWGPTGADMGTQTVIVQVDDGRGGSTQQRYALSVIAPPPNRPPVFTSVPAVDGSVSTAYSYQARAADPDDDPLTFSVVSGPTGLTVDPSTGLVDWTPTAAQLGTQAVTLRVADGHGGSADQVYQILVGNEPGNHAPVFVSEPPTQLNLPGPGNPPSGTVDPTSVDLNLGRGDSATTTVSLTVPAGGIVPKADVFLLLDDTSSFGNAGPNLIAQFPNLIAQLQAALPNVNLAFGVGRFEDYAGRDFDPNFDTSYTRPFTLNQPILSTTVPGFEAAIEAALTRSGPGLGGDVPESLLEGLYQTATGVGFDGNGDGNTTESGPATLAQTQVGPGDSGDVPAFDSRDDIIPYHARLLDVAQQTPLSLGALVSGSLNPSAESDLYTFTGTAGQRVFFDSLSVSQSPGRWALYGPDAQLVPGSSNPLGTDFEVTLPASGSYLLVVRRDLLLGTEGFGTVPLDYSFRASLPPTTTTPVTLNTPVQGTIAVPRQRDQYTFTLANTSLIYLDAQTNDARVSWSLEGPAGPAVSGRPFNQTDGADAVVSPVLRLVPGDYTLTVERAGDSTGAYQFALWDLAAATPLVPGTPVSGSLVPANETDLYRFNAAAGDRFFFDMQARTGAPGAGWRLIDPYGNVLFNTGFADVATLTLAQPGAYTLLIEGRLSDTGTGIYTFTVQPQGNVPPPAPPPSTPYVLGSTVSDSISVAGEQDRYRFTLPSDSLLYFDSLTLNGNLNWTLVGPAGTAVSNRVFTASDASNIANPVLNLVAGDYTLTVAASGGATGNYSFRLSELAQATPLTPGTPVSGSLSPADETDLYSFTAAAGDRFFFDAQARTSAPNATWRLIDPYGNVAFASTSFGSASSDVDVTALARPGRYTLLLEGSIFDTGAGTYTINVQPARIDTAPLTLGSTVSGSITTAGEQDRYTFTLSSGSRLYFDALTNNTSLAWTLTGPAGTVVSGRRFTASDGGSVGNPVLNLIPGDYTLTIDPPGDAVGDYAFRLWDLRQATALTPGTPVSGALTPATESDLYRFTASAGDRFFFDTLARTGAPNATWRLIDPDGKAVFNSTFGGTFADVDVQTLASPGQYTLVLEGGIGDTGSGTYTINVQPAPINTAPLTLGSTVSGSITTAGAQDRYTFTLASASLLYFDALTDNQNLTWTLVGPAGTPVSGRRFTASDDGGIANPVLRVPAGDYSLTVDLPGDQTGPYSFRLWRLDQATPLTPGTPVSGSLSPGNETDLYRFDAAAGDRFFFDAQSATSVTWRLIDPYGNVVFSTSFADVPTLTLAQPGAYTLLLEGQVSAIGAAAYAFTVQSQGNVPPPAPPPSTPYTLGSTVSDSISVAGEQDRYRFTLTSDSLLDFDALTNNQSLTWTLAGPAGTAVSNRVFTQSDGRSVSGNPVLSLPAGDYTLTVQGTGSFTGAYQFRLWDLRQANPLMLGSEVGGQFAPANETDLYRFDAEAGQKYYFDVQARFGTGDDQWRLIDPYGNVVFTKVFNDISDADAGPLALPVSGTYTLLLEAAISDTASGGYIFVVNAPAGVQSDVALDAAVGGNLTQPADVDAYTFQGLAGQMFYYDGLDVGTHNSFTTGGVRARLTSPSGASLLDVAAADDDGGPVLLPETGTYTLTIDPAGVNFNRGLPASGTLGGAGFRPGSLPIILAATDAATVYQPDGITTIHGVGGVTVPLANLTNGSRNITPGGRGASFQPTIDALNQLGALVIGLGTNTETTIAPRQTLESLAILTGAVNRSTQTIDSNITGDPIAPGDPLYFLINTNSPTTVAGGVVSAVASAIQDTTFDIDVVASDPTVSVENLTGVVQGVGPNRTVSFDTRITGDGQAHSFDLLFVRAGTGVVLGSVPVTINNDLLYPAQALDPDGDTVTYSLVSGPAGAVVDSHTGKLDWEPAAAGSYPFRLRAEDGRGGVAFQDFTVTVTSGQPDQAPTIISVAPAHATAALPFSYRVTATDPNGDALSYYLDAAPAGMTIDRATGVVTWTPDAGQVGTQHVAVRVLDGRGGEAAQSFDLAVAAQAANQRPVFTSAPPKQATLGQVYRYEAGAADPDADPLRFDLLVGPAGMTLDSATGIVVWEPTADQAGAADVILRVSDGRGGVALQSYQVAASTVGTAPVISTPAPTAPAVVGRPYQYHFRAQDAEGDTLTFQLTAAPGGMTVDPVTGVLSWSPTAAQVGPQPVTLTVIDSRGLGTRLPFTITVLLDAPNDPPVISSTPRTSIRLGETYLYQVAASDPNNDALTYTLVAPPAGMIVDANGLVSWHPDPSQLGDQPIQLRVSDGRGRTASQDFTLRVVTSDINLPPVITSTPPGTGTVGRPYTYNLTGSDPEDDPLFWALDKAPAGMSLDATRGTLRWQPTVDQIGSAEVVVRLVDGQGASSTQRFAVVVRGVDLPPVVVSTPPTQGSTGQAYFYAVRADDPEADTLTFALTTRPSGMTINRTIGLITWTPASIQTGPNNVTVLVSDGQGGAATQTFTVVVTASVNHPPTITTASVTDALVGLAYRYGVGATDSEGDALTFALPAAPTGMTIDPSTGVITWTPTASQAGSQRVVLTVTDAAGNVAGQIYTLLVQATNQSPVIESTAVESATAGLVYRYDVKASDPDNNALAYELTTAPAGMAIDALGRITWATAAADIGSHPITVAVTDLFGASVSQSYNLVVSSDTQAPSVFLNVSTSRAAVGSQVNLIVLATDNVGVTDLVLTVNGAPVLVDPTGRAVFTADHVGAFDVVARAADAAGNTQTVQDSFTVFDPANDDPPVVALTSPDDDEIITAPRDVRGTVTDTDLLFYTLSVAPVSGGQFAEIARGTSNVTDGVLGTLDPTLLLSDSYILRLQATDAGGHVATLDRQFNVSDNLKLGNFTLSFTDLTVPVSGIPISVTRTYDTLTAAQSGDLGFGWRLEFRDVDVRSSVAPRTDELAADLGFHNPFRDGTRVYVTLPGGQRQGFTFQPQISRLTRLLLEFLPADSDLPEESWQYDPIFVPDPGVTSSLTLRGATTMTRDATGAYFGALVSGDIPFNPADPLYEASYTLTTNDGLAYNIDAATGKLLGASDANGNTVTFTANGITSSTGVGVTFQRDPQGRITSVTDPQGQQVKYRYDLNGDLVAVTDRTNNATQFVYRQAPAHYLDQVIDPLGRTGVRTEYDAQGRLTRLIDAAGNSVQTAYDPTHLLSTVTDRLGHTTTEEYDDRGNTVRSIDALGGATLRTFDADGNLLTETDPLGRTTTFTYDDQGNVLTQTDPLGNTTTSTYQAFPFGTTVAAALSGEPPHFSRLTTSTDPLGDTSHARYDSEGNLVAQTDSLGNTTTLSYDAAGNPTEITDPLGNSSDIQYDDSGYRTQVVDADGHVTNFTNDANGNPLSQTQADGSGWSLSYSAAGLPTNFGVIGLPHTVQYDALNQITQVTQPTGQTETLDYDALGQVTQITLPDGTIAQRSTYDAVGNLVAVTDSLGNVTRYSYDADNQLIQTTYADGSTEKRSYDLAGELVEETDALGNSTRYVYDDAGRQIQVTDALGGVTSTVYDAADRVVAVTDPLGRTTRYQYDADGQQVAVIAPDGSTARNVYDAGGRLVQTVDAAGHATVNGYDPGGNLVSVTDALGNVTRYQYGDSNERVAITDARGNVTRFGYDAQGHLVQTTQPDGETDGSTYDSAGQLASTTNGDGQTIHFGYDVRGRLTFRTLPDGSQETYTYTSDGLLSSVRDANGTTRYDYDPVTRLLVRVTQPDGRYVRYAYDARGDRTLMADGMGAGLPEDITQYAYDALGRLVQVTDPQGGVTGYGYDADGNPTTTTLPNGVTETDTYDTLNRLITVVAKDAGGTTISSFSYTLDMNGNRTAEVDADGSRHVYTYDALNRVTSEDHFDSGGVSMGAEVYSYDALGDVMARTGSLLGGATFNYNGDNQLVSGAGSTYIYDGAGNLLSVTDSAGNVRRYAYDARGRLISSQAPDGGITSYTYDFQGVRQSQQGPGGLVKYLVDAASGPGSAQVLRESDATGATLRTYVIGRGLLSFTEGRNVRYYLTDGLGSTRLLTDRAGAVTDTYLYSAYGVLLGRTGSSANPFLFAGQQQDGASGLLYMRARYYDPATGRFLSRDPFAGLDQLPLSLNKYLYALANPINDADPSGNTTLAEEEIVVQEEQILEEVDAVAYAHTAFNLFNKAFQFIGGLGVLAAACWGIFDPEVLGDYFTLSLTTGPNRRPAPPTSEKSRAIRELAGVASEIPLTATAVWMLGVNVTYELNPTLGPNVLAEVNPRRPAPYIVFVTPLYERLTVLPPPASPVRWCQVGVLIHEFVHLASRGRVRDFGRNGYEAGAFNLSPIQALRNADNYRLAVQGLDAGLNAASARESLAPSFFTA